MRWVKFLLISFLLIFFCMLAVSCAKEDKSTNFQSLIDSLSESTDTDIDTDIDIDTDTNTDPDTDSSEPREYGIRLNGIELSEYTIVYPEAASDEEKAFAYSLQGKIIDGGECFLNVLSEKQAQKATGKIFIGNSIFNIEEENAAYVLSNGGAYIELYAPDKYGYRVLEKRFCELLFENDNTTSVEISEHQKFSYDGSDFAFFVLSSPPSPMELDDYVMISEAIISDAASITFGLDGENLKNVRNNAGNEYAAQSDMLCFVNDSYAKCERLETIQTSEGKIIVLEMVRRSDGSPLTFIVALADEGASKEGRAEVLGALTATCREASSPLAVACSSSLFSKTEWKADSFGLSELDKPAECEGVFDIYFTVDKLEPSLYNCFEIEDGFFGTEIGFKYLNF